MITLGHSKIDGHHVSQQCARHDNPCIMPVLKPIPAPRPRRATPPPGKKLSITGHATSKLRLKFQRVISRDPQGLQSFPAHSHNLLFSESTSRVMQTRRDSFTTIENYHDDLRSNFENAHVSGRPKKVRRTAECGHGARASLSPNL
ncbi:hypothetical protein J6590_007036 [Homalodisca vitripennis]|nr:hypothetical protein J6590_007036 [Homalodisca vitripennis]